MAMPRSYKDLLLQLRVEIRQNLKIDGSYFLDYAWQCGLFTQEQVQRFSNKYHPQNERVGEILDDLEKGSNKALSKFCFCLEIDNQNVLLEKIKLKAQQLGIAGEKLDSPTLRRKLQEDVNHHVGTSVAGLLMNPNVGPQETRKSKERYVKIGTLASVLKDTYVGMMKNMAEVQMQLLNSPNIQFYELYTQLELITKSPIGGEVKLETLEDHEAILSSRKKGKRPLFTLLEGDAGIGKTTTLKNLLLIWCNLSQLQKIFGHHVLSKFQIVVFIFLRSVPAGSTVASYIRSQIPLECTFTEKEIKSIIEVNSEKLLFICDGWDEYHQNSDEINHVLNGHYLQHSTKILSTRPTHLPRVNQFPHDRMIHISGFSKTGQEKYINKYFLQSKMNADNLIKEIEIKGMQAISHVPFLLMVMCALHKHSEILSVSKTDLYKQLLEFMHKRQKEKMQDISEPEAIIKTTGKQAFLTLFAGELEFSLQEENKQVKDALQTGILQRIFTFQPHKTGDILVSFYHKSIHEYVCGQYICTCTGDEFNDLLEQLDVIKITSPTEIYNITAFCDTENSDNDVGLKIKERTTTLLNYMNKHVLNVLDIKTLGDMLLFPESNTYKIWVILVKKLHSRKQPAFSSPSGLGLLLRYNVSQDHDLELWEEEKDLTKEVIQRKALPMSLNLDGKRNASPLILRTYEEKMIQVHGLHNLVDVSRLTFLRLSWITLDDICLHQLLDPPRKIFHLENAFVTTSSCLIQSPSSSAQYSLTHVVLGDVQGDISNRLLLSAPSSLLLAKALTSSTLQYLHIWNTKLEKKCESVFRQAPTPHGLTHIRLFWTSPALVSWVGRGYTGPGRVRKAWENGPWKDISGGPGQLKGGMQYESHGFEKLDDLPVPDNIYEWTKM